MADYRVSGGGTYKATSGPDTFHVDGPEDDPKFQYGVATINGFDPTQDTLYINLFYELADGNYVTLKLGDRPEIFVRTYHEGTEGSFEIDMNTVPTGHSLQLGDESSFELEGSDGNDNLLVSPVQYEPYRIYGGGGDDIISDFGLAAVRHQDYQSYEYSPLIDGGSGFDIVSFAGEHAAANETVNQNFLQNIEGLIGTSFNDVLTGDTGVNRLEGGDGDDQLNGAGGGDTILGGAGNDSISGGAGSTLDGGDGNDAIGAGAGSTVTAGAGDDQVYAALGGDQLAGGDGIDTLHLSGSAGVTVDLSQSGAQATGPGTDTITGFENLVGTTYADHLTGTAAANSIDGDAGDDTVSGGDGNDTLTGGAGNDTLDGGNGDDLVIGSAGNDILYGSFGVDTVSYADATAGVTVEMAVATAQNTGGAGIDTLNSFENLIGSAHNDAISGTLKANHIDGGAGNDTLYGEDNNDVLVGAAGNDVMDGGNGTDTASFAGETGGGVHLVLDADGDGVTSGAAGIDRLFSIESLIGSDAADVLAGNNGANSIDGGLGNDSLKGQGGDDTLLGGAGDDVLMGGAGNDMLDGGAGTDRASYSDATGGVTVDLSHAGAQATGGAGTDTLTGIEQLFGSAYADTLTGDAGNNLLDGGAGADHLNGGLGNDTYYVDNPGDQITDTGGTDLVYSTVDVNIGYWTSVENVTLLRDALVAKGNALDNHIVGDDGNNTLMGKLGDDTLTGGKGADAFRFDTPLGDHNIDTVTDFTPGTDRIELARSVFGAAGGTGTLPSSAFQVGTVPESANAHILYDSSTGALFYDPDGSGHAAAMEFAKVAAGTALTAADIVIV